MRDFRDAKAMAQSLRHALNAKSVSLTRGECLELVAKTLGFPDWNVLAARIQAGPPHATGAGPSVPTATPPSISVGADVPTVPMRDLVLFPQMVNPLFVGRPKTIRAVEFARRVAAVNVLRAKGAQDIERADGTWQAGQWIDFDPLKPPLLVDLPAPEDVQLRK